MIDPADTRREIAAALRRARRQARAPRSRASTTTRRSDAPRPLRTGRRRRRDGPLVVVRRRGASPADIRVTTREQRGRDHHHHRQPHRQDRRGPDHRRRCSRRRRVRELDPASGIYDPAFMTTAACTQRDHRPRRRGRHPALPRLPDRAAGRAVAPTSRWPTCCSTASCPTSRAVRAVEARRSRTTRSSTRTCASGSWRASTTTPTRWACSCRPLAALSTFYPEAKDIDDPDDPRQADRAAHRQDADARRRRATASASGMPFVYPDNTLDFPANFLSMMWKVAEPRYEADPVLARALDVLFILHADHEQNCGTTAMRVVGSRHADPYSRRRRGRRRPLRPAATAAPTRPSSACSPRSARSTTCRPSSTT